MAQVYNTNKVFTYIQNWYAQVQYTNPIFTHIQNWDARVNHASWRSMLHMKKKGHYFTTNLCVWQNFHLPHCSPLPASLHQQPVSSLAPPRNRYSSNTPCNTINYFLVVKQTTRRLNPSKINGGLDGSCNFLFNWICVSKGADDCGMECEAEAKPRGTAILFRRIPSGVTKSVGKKWSRHKNFWWRDPASSIVHGLPTLWAHSFAL